MATDPQYKTIRRSRPPFALTVELAQKGQITPEEAKKILIDVISKVPAEELHTLDLRAGQLTIIV